MIIEFILHTQEARFVKHEGDYSLDNLLKAIFVRFIDGLELSGDTFNEIMVKLWDNAHFEESETLNDYMEGVAERARIYTGKPISYSDPETLIRELYRVGIVTELTERGEIH